MEEDEEGVKANEVVYEFEGSRFIPADGGVIKANILNKKTFLEERKSCTL